MANSRRTDVLVLGAGVSGLTTATRLVMAGRSVRIVAARRPAETTSANAGASWGPYMVSDSRVLEWSERTREALSEIANEPTSGVRLVHGIEASTSQTPPPDWAKRTPEFRMCDRHELPEGYVSGWHYQIPLIDMHRYLAYLLGRLRDKGVEIELRTVDSFAELAGEANLIVNCTGLGSRTLANDTSLYPIRGQLVVVENPGITEFFQEDSEGEELIYILPHENYVVLGGCALKDVGVSGPDGTIEPDPDIGKQIIERCAWIRPELRDAVPIRYLVGLRPNRPTVRLERETTTAGEIIHNYGHGGAGVTLSWGCAEVVNQLAAEVLD